MCRQGTANVCDTSATCEQPGPGRALGPAPRSHRRGVSPWIIRAQNAVTVSTALGEQRSLHIACYPDRPAGEEELVEAVLIVVADVTQAVHAQRELERRPQLQPLVQCNWLLATGMASTTQPDKIE